MVKPGVSKRLVVSLSVVAFISGFALMVFELAAARLLAPSIGSSIFVWTNVIGVIMLALSVGYYLGGWLADRRQQSADVVVLCFAAGGLVLLTSYLAKPLLDLVVEIIADSRSQGLVASLVLFAPTSIVLGMISPYLVRLSVSSLDTSGRAFARISIMNTIGSVIGTFLTGFVLFNFLGVREALAFVVFLLMVAGWLLSNRSIWNARLIATIILATLTFGLLFSTGTGAIETPTTSYLIKEFSDNSGRVVRGLVSGPGGVQSGVLVDDPNELAFWYTNRMAEAVEVVPRKASLLMLGGGTLTLPRYLAERFPDMTIDVVEIDSGLTDIARRHFAYNDTSRISIHYDDARAYVNHAKSKYDIVLVDVYSDTSVPFSMMTTEYGRAISRLLAEGGVVVVNAIVSPEGACRPLYQAIRSAYQPVSSGHFEMSQNESGLRGNMIMVFGRNDLQLPGYRWVAGGSGNHYTDNYMPAEALQQRCQSA